MNKFLFLLIVSMLFLNCAQKPEVNEDSENANDTELLTHMKTVLWPKAYAEQDTVLLDEILGEDFQMIDQSGNWYTKEDELSWIKEHATQHDSFFYEIKRLEFPENGTAIICGTGHILNDSISTTYQSSNVLVKREGKWKAVLSHVSGIKEEN